MLKLAILGYIDWWAEAKTVLLSDEALPRVRPEEVRIYTYKLPVCSFEHFEAKEIDGTPNWGHQQFHAGRPPLLPIHRKLAYGRLATDDPHNATHFYIPAPFFFWDDSWQGTKEVCQETNARRLLHNRFLEREISIMAPASSKKGWLFSLWLRTQVHEPPDEFSLLLQIHNAHQKRSLRVGVQGGCLLMSLGNLQFSPGCQTSLANGEWHHVAGFMWSNLSAGLFLDFSHQGDFDFSDCCNDEKEDVVQALKEGWHIGGADAWSDVDLDCSIEKFFQSCASASPQESSNSPCLQRVRSFVESQPWLKRRRGWDHIVLFAGVDYPARFDPNHPLGDDDFVLEKAWPEFKSFVLLHHGARTERCLAHLTDPSYLKNDGTYEECARRVFQTVTIPPLFEDENFDCAQMAIAAKAKRPHRVAFRGLQYDAMVERREVCSALSEAHLHQLQATGDFRLEFTNWTHELVRNGVCREAFAFDRLCAWSSVGTSLNGSAFEQVGSSRAKSMKKQARELWAHAETGLVLPGDGGYELRLYSMLNKAAVPVFFNHRGVSFPKLPFTALLPWSKFAIFWDSGQSRRVLGEANDGAHLLRHVDKVGAAYQLLLQLALMDPQVIEKKRRKLLRYAPSLSWETPRCPGTLRKSALDHLGAELAHRLTRFLQTSSGLIHWLDWYWKVADDHLENSQSEDLTGTGCPLGYPICQRHEGGNICVSTWRGTPFACPIGCEVSEVPPLCQTPTGAACNLPAHPRHPCGEYPHQNHPAEVPYPDHIVRRPRVALITWSDRPQVSRMTLPALERFCEEHPGRYELIVEQAPILDSSTFVAAWNKIAFMRRVLLTRLHDAVLWIDDDVLITAPTRDPIFEGLKKSILRLHSDHFIYASKDVRHDERVPMNTGILGLRNGRQALKFLEEMFRIAREVVVLDEQAFVPRYEGWWDQDAAAEWVRRHGLKWAYLEEHRTIQSLVRDWETMKWQPGDFAAHFSGIRNEAVRMKLMQQFQHRQVLEVKGGW
ncbi:unnamed protein product [Effrenium voratum]|nr:unnamed protein product [Effrenium voratum]